MNKFITKDIEDYGYHVLTLNNEKTQIINYDFVTPEQYRIDILYPQLPQLSSVLNISDSKLDFLIETSEFGNPDFGPVNVSKYTIKTNKGKYGNYYMPYYEDQIDLFVDDDGTDYTVNQDQALFHYKWTNGRYGIGYYLVRKE